MLCVVFDFLFFSRSLTVVLLLGVISKSQKVRSCQIGVIGAFRFVNSFFFFFFFFFFPFLISSSLFFHRCKMRKARVTACDNFFSTDKEKRCNGRYCDGCVQRHYLEDAAEFASLPHWICFRCTGRCTCAACKRRRKGDDGGMGLDGSVGGAGGSEVGSSGPASSVRRREPKRYADELELDDDDDDFDPLPQTATRRPEVQDNPYYYDEEVFSNFVFFSPFFFFFLFCCLRSVPLK